MDYDLPPQHHPDAVSRRQKAWAERFDKKEYFDEFYKAVGDLVQASLVYREENECQKCEDSDCDVCEDFNKAQNALFSFMYPPVG